MAYLVKLGAEEAARKAAALRRPRSAPADWRAELAERWNVALALVGVIVLCGGVVTAFTVANRPAVVAVGEPNSAQELVDDQAGLGAVSATGEVVDDSGSSASGR